MVGISFSGEEFPLRILSGIKTTTIRKRNDIRENMMRGLGMQLFYKQRTKDCRLIGYAWPEEFEHIFLQGWLVTATEDDAIKDGFDSLADMRAYFSDVGGEYTRIRFRLIDKETFDTYRTPSNKTWEDD